MSRKIPALVTAAAAALTVAAGVTAANASVPAPPPSGTSTPPAVPSPSASTTQSASASESSPAPESSGAASSPLDECRDANCTVEIADGQQIVLDEKFGMAPIQVAVRGTRVTFATATGNSHAIASVDASQPYTSASFNGITLRPHMTEDGRMMLTVSHA